MRSLPAEGLLLFVGHYAILAWGRHGEAWQSEKLSDEGVTITGIEHGVLHGRGWNMITDKESPFDARPAHRAPSSGATVSQPGVSWERKDVSCCNAGGRSNPILQFNL